MAASENGGDPEDEMSEGKSVKQHRQQSKGIGSWMMTKRYLQNYYIIGN